MGTTLPPVRAPAYQGRWADGITYDLECVEIGERFARNDQF